jgi:hypothetical protein
MKYLAKVAVELRVQWLVYEATRCGAKEGPKLEVL